METADGDIFGWWYNIVSFLNWPHFEMIKQFLRDCISEERNFNQGSPVLADLPSAMTPSCCKLPALALSASVLESLFIDSCFLFPGFDGLLGPVT
jgi:hypothetical protein